MWLKNELSATLVTKEEIFRQKKIPCLSKGFSYLAGAEGLEPPTPGFGDRCSTN